MKNLKEKRDALWWGLRVGFWGMIAAFISLLIILGIFSRGVIRSSFTVFIINAVVLLFPVFTLSSIVFSIINLIKNKDKLFSVVALISSIVLILVTFVYIVFFTFTI